MKVLALPSDLRPDMASLTLSSLNFATGASVNKPDEIRALTEKMQKSKVRPELEIFDLGMIAFAHKLIEEGLLAPPYFFNIILGNVAGAQLNLVSVAALLADLPEDSVVSLGGIGKIQRPAHLLALCCADGVRTGLEDNLWMSKNREAAKNEDLVRRIVDLAELSERPPENTLRTRERLGLRSAW